MPSLELKTSDQLEYVVMVCENYLNSYFNRIVDNIQKPGTATNALVDIMEMEKIFPNDFDGNYQLFCPVICKVLIKMFQETNTKFNHIEVERVLILLYNFKVQPSAVRKMLVEYANAISKGAVFEDFEDFEDIKCDILKNSSNNNIQNITNSFLNEVLENYYTTNPQNSYIRDEDIHEHVRVLLSYIDKEDPMIAVKSEKMTCNIEQTLICLEKYIADNLETFKLFIKTNKDEIRKYFSNLNEQNLKMSENICITTSCNESLQPFWFGINDRFSPFIGRKEQLLYIHKNLQEKNIMVICGLDGVGKRTLTMEYVYNYFSRTDYVFNIDLSTEEKAQVDINIVHNKLGLNTRYGDGEEKSLEFIMNEVYDKVGDRGLFIFNNAENYAAVRKFLPHTVRWKPFILITSPNVSKKEWSSRRLKVKMLKLDSFTDDEASELVKTSLEIKDASIDNTIKELTKKLHNFPLGLVESVRYIKNRCLISHGENIKLEISEYLRKYNENCKRYFSNDTDESTNLLFKTLDITINKIKNDNEYGEQAIDMLHMLSYFMPNDIPDKIFVDINEIDDKSINIINLLRKYDILQINDGMIAINGLVQEMVRLKLKSQKKEEQCLKKVLDFFNKKLTTQEDADMYLHHLISVWKYASKYSDIFQNKENVYYTYLKNIMRDS